MGQRIILDSNIVIYYCNAAIPQNGKQFLDGYLSMEINISVITKIEVLGWNSPQTLDSLVLENFVQHALIHHLSDEIVEESIRIRKFRKIKTADAIIAATSKVNGFKLVSRNTVDFKNIPGLEVINPFEL